MIFEHVPKRGPDHFERTAAVMPFEVLHVLQQECRRPVMLEDRCDVEEKVALMLVLETVLAPK
jgi:hypothetical protein